MLRYLNSMKFALNGIFHALRTERNVQIWFVVFVLTNSLAYWLNVTRDEAIIIFVSMTLIGSVEYLNTAVETLADRITTERDEYIKNAKDVAAGATFLISIASLIVSLIILVPYIIEKFALNF